MDLGCRFKLRECARRLWHTGLRDQPTNTPGARRQPIAWTDAAGNFWLFGGNSVGNVGMLNDLWEYGLSAKQWVWQGGSGVVGAAASYGAQGVAAAGNNPGAREGSAKWTDAAGNLWLFGGDSLAAQNWEEFNDLWSYSPTTGLWTWVGGSNTAANAGSYGTLGVAAASNLPPARTVPISWMDSAGVFWLFGGAQLNSNGSYLAVFNDLWSYNPTTGLWTWVGGSSTPNAAGVYGTQGIAATSNVPGARLGGSVWLDAGGNVWLFGGLGLGQSGLTQEYNDLWEYSPASGAVDLDRRLQCAQCRGHIRYPACGRRRQQPGRARLGGVVERPGRKLLAIRGLRLRAGRQYRKPQRSVGVQPRRRSVDLDRRLLIDSRARDLRYAGYSLHQQCARARANRRLAGSTAAAISGCSAASASIHPACKTT